MLGAGEMVENWMGHWEESVEVRGCSFASVETGARREMECIEVIEGRERRVERMLAPLWDD